MINEDQRVWAFFGVCDFRNRVTPQGVFFSLPSFFFSVPSPFWQELRCLDIQGAPTHALYIECWEIFWSLIFLVGNYAAPWVG